MHTVKRLNFLPSLAMGLSYGQGHVSQVCLELLENLFVSSCCLDYGCYGWSFRSPFRSLRMKVTCKHSEDKNERSMNPRELWGHHHASLGFLTTEAFLGERNENSSFVWNDVILAFQHRPSEVIIPNRMQISGPFTGALSLDLKDEWNIYV